MKEFWACNSRKVTVLTPLHVVIYFLVALKMDISSFSEFLFYLLIVFFIFMINFYIYDVVTGRYEKDRATKALASQNEKTDTSATDAT